MFIKNIPSEIPDASVEAHFLKFGEIQSIKVNHRPGALTKIAYVNYKDASHASDCIYHSELNPHVWGNKIMVDYYKPKSMNKGENTEVLHSMMNQWMYAMTMGQMPSMPNMPGMPMRGQPGMRGRGAPRGRGMPRHPGQSAAQAQTSVPQTAPEQAEEPKKFKSHKK